MAQSVANQHGKVLLLYLKCHQQLNSRNKFTTEMIHSLRKFIFYAPFCCFLTRIWYWWIPAPLSSHISHCTHHTKDVYDGGSCSWLYFTVESRHWDVGRARGREHPCQHNAWSGKHGDWASTPNMPTKCSPVKRIKAEEWKHSNGTLYICIHMRFQSYIPLYVNLQV